MTTGVLIPNALTPDGSGHYLAELLGIPFSAEQLAVITAPLGPQLVIAGAGSGKTTVMAARVVHAVAFHGIAPSAVLGLTFTNKAASELAERVRRALARLGAVRAGLRESGAGLRESGAGLRESGAGLRESGATPTDGAPADDVPTVATYHSYAGQIVADHALRIGREPQTRLLTEAARWQVAARVARLAPGPFQHLRWTTPFVAQYVLDLDGEMSEHLVDIGDVRGVDARIRAQVAGAGDTTKAVLDVATVASERDELLQLVAAYRDRKRVLDAVDFGDLVALAARIAESCPEVADTERRRFAVVFLDEYQDTGVGQRRLLAALFGGGHPVTAVGDPSQSIYGWRGASAGNLLRFPEHFQRSDGTRCTPQFLLTSFRNGTNILRAANVLSESLRSGSPRQAALVEVPALASATGACAGAVRVALHSTVEDEAAWLADQVADQLMTGRRPRDVAVLCRRRSDFGLFHRHLVARDIPVEVVGLAGLLTMPEVSDVVAVLEAIADPTANAALVRILTGPRWRIGPRDLAALGRRASALCDTGRRHVGIADDPDGAAALADATASVDPCDVVALSDALVDPGDPAGFSPEAVRRFADLAAELTRLRRLAGHQVVEIVSRVVSAIGLDVEIEASPARVAAARAANLAAFSDHAARFESVDGDSDLPAFLAYLAAAETAENGLDVGAVSTADTVKLLTVHKAKGLEWPVVAVPCLADGTFPSGQSRSRWTEAARVLPFALRGDRNDLPADPDLTTKGIAAFKASCREQEAAEERRLAYVAVTRAKELLLVSGHVWNATRTKPCGLSPYLEELAAVARDGGGEVPIWTQDVPAANPLLTREVPDVAWPAAYDAGAHVQRRQAAGLVTQALAQAQALADRPVGPAPVGPAPVGPAPVGPAPVGPAPVGPAPVGPATRWPTVAATGHPADHLTGHLTGHPTADSAVVPTGADALLAAQWARDTDRLLDELARDAAGERDIALPRTLTTSQVVALAESADDFAAGLARPMPRKPTAAARRGTAFHAWVEHRFESRPLFDADDLPGAGDDAVPFDDEQLEALRSAFAASPYGDVRPHAIEAPFEITVGARLVRGRIDAVYATPGGFEVVDYKTGMKPRDMAAAAWQLAVYRLAWAGLAGVPVEAVTAAFLYVRSGELVRPDLLDGAGLERLLSGGHMGAAPREAEIGQAGAILAEVVGDAPIETQGERQDATPIDRPGGSPSEAPTVTPDERPDERPTERPTETPDQAVHIPVETAMTTATDARIAAPSPAQARASRSRRENSPDDDQLTLDW